MIRHRLLGLLSVSLCLMSLEVSAIDYSGIYDCTGKDAHEGDYTGIAMLRLQPQHSHGHFASYQFKLSVPNYGLYKGHAAFHGQHAAIHFSLAGTRDYGTGIATFGHDSKGRVFFNKFYYEPVFKGGNTGTEHCIRR